mgnify:CR=1 FL=1|tara:strand:+ start:39 stop:1508 length:1470 start_codon:yes stop_codon:yes gene_type:complete
MAIGSKFTRRAPATLADLAQQYLNQGLPDISGIFQPVTDTPVVETPVEETTSGITPLLLQQMGGDGGGGGPFNISANDPNVRTIRDYNARPAYEAAFGTMMGDPEANIATGALNTSGIMGPYQERPPSKIQELLSNTMLGRGIKGIGSFAKNLLSGLPPNRAGIFQNELLGGGFMLDNMGRLVTNNYNTPEGIMAGYNPVSGGLLNLVTGGKMGEETNYGLDKSYDKRRETVSKTLKEKYGMTDEEIAAAVAGEYEGDVPINPATGLPTDLINRLDLFNKSQNLLNKRLGAADIIYNKKLEEKQKADVIGAMAKTQGVSRQEAQRQQRSIGKDNQRTEARGKADLGSSYDSGTYCFDPSTPIQMADGSTKEIKNIQLGDDTKGGEVTGVFQFKASDEIHDYKGVTVAGSHYVKEDGRFIMVKDSPLSVKIDKIPVVYSLDTSGRRIFINDIEFADYNGDGIAKGFLANAGVDITGFDKEVLRQVENRLI